MCKSVTVDLMMSAMYDCRCAEHLTSESVTLTFDLRQNAMSLRAESGQPG